MLERTSSRSAEPASNAATVGSLAVLVLIWGSNYPWVKLALQDSGAWTFNALRFLVGTGVLAAALGVLRGWRSLLPEAPERSRLAVVGVLQFGVMGGGSTLALLWIEASRTVLIAYTMPIWAMLLSFLLYRERPSLPMLAGAALGVSGLAILSSPWAMDWSSADALRGAFAIFVGTLGWALGAVLYRGSEWKTPQWSQVFWQIVAAAMVLTFAGLALETRPLNPTIGYSAIVLYIAVVPTVLGHWVWTLTLRRIPVSTAGQALTVSPLVGVAVSAAVLHEPITPSLLVSGVLIVAGALLSYSRPRR